MAGGIVAQGFLGLRLNPWLMRLVTRGSALVPAVLVVVLFGDQPAPLVSAGRDAARA